MAGGKVTVIYSLKKKVCKVLVKWDFFSHPDNPLRGLLFL